MSHIKKILIISKSIYPINNPRSHRATELAKEFGKQGFEVVLYGEKAPIDYSSIEIENNIKIKDLGKLYFSSFYIKNKFWKRITSGMSIILNRFIEFPDIDILFKIPRIIKNEKKTDLLITIAFPYTIHWGAALAKTLKFKYFPSLWIADCGDPYMGNPNIKRPFYFKYLEKWFCNKVDYLTVPTKQSVEAYYSEFNHKIKVIPQGFKINENDDLPIYTPNKTPTFIYAGAFYEKIRDPRPFLNYLTKIKQEFKFLVFTNHQRLIEEYTNHLGERLEIRNYLPRNEVIKEFAKADFLINFQNKEKTQTPSKLIDYSIAGRPVLNIFDSKDFPFVVDFINKNYDNRMILPDKEQYDIKKIGYKFLSIKN